MNISFLSVTPGIGLNTNGEEIFAYGGDLTDNGLRIGVVPAGFSAYGADPLQKGTARNGHAVTGS